MHNTVLICSRWSEHVSADMMDQTLEMINEEIPETISFMQVLTQEIYEPVMAGKCPAPAFELLTAKYPAFFGCVVAQVAANRPLEVTSIGPSSFEKLCANVRDSPGTGCEHETTRNSGITPDSRSRRAESTENKTHAVIRPLSAYTLESNTAYTLTAESAQAQQLEYECAVALTAMARESGGQQAGA